MPSRLATALGIRPAPGGAGLRINIWLACVFAMIFGVVYVGADLLSATVYDRTPLAFGFEAGIPFVPQMAIVYLSIIPLLLLAPVLLTPRRLVPLFIVLCAEVLVAGFVYLLLPMQEIFPTRQPERDVGMLFRVADTLNLNHNDLPSLHVALSLTAAAVYTKFCNAAGKAVFVSWALLIPVSSVLMHQHHLADVAGGGLLAVAGMVLVYPVVSKPAFLDAVRVESICVSEFAAFARRHPRYLVIAFFIYGYSLFRWRRMRVMRAGFCLLQSIDDLLDGDRPSAADPLETAGVIAGQLQSGRFGTDRLGILAGTLAGELRRFRDPGEDALDEVVALIRHMMIDRERASRRLLFDAGTLRRHHRETFTRSLNLLLIVAGAKTRAGDAPGLIEAFGWCSTMRDLREDLGHGLVNIPRDVVEAAAAEGAPLSDFDRLIETRAVRSWCAAELERARQLLDDFANRVRDPRDPTGERILNIFHRSIARFARRFERKFAGATALRSVRSSG